MSETSIQKLGDLNGRGYFLVIDVDLDWSNVDSFSLTVFYRELDPRTGDEKKVEIARIDNRSHGHAHFDRLFEPGQPMEPFEGSVWEAWENLEENWRKYARRYKRNHG